MPYVIWGGSCGPEIGGTDLLSRKFLQMYMQCNVEKSVSTCESDISKRIISLEGLI